MPRMKWVFYHRGVECDGNSPWEKPLGGTESALILMARALAVLDQDVHVFTETRHPGIYTGVEYHRWEDFERFAHFHPIDIFIGIRQLLPFLARRFGRMQIYFSPDAWDQPFLHEAFQFQTCIENQNYQIRLYPLHQLLSTIDRVFCVGHWQAETFVTHLKIPREKIYVTANGVHLEDFHPLPLKNRKRQLVYSSTPFRGLEYLLKYFPHVRSQVPEAQCVVLSGMQLYGLSRDEDQEKFASIYQLAQQPGVILSTPLAKKEMARVLSESRVLAYPNTFPETFCIAALEAQAAGLPIVTTESGALCERVHEGEDGYLISGHPSQSAYAERWIEKVIRLLTEDAEWESMSEKALIQAKNFSYLKLAAQWIEYCQDFLNSNPQGIPTSFQIQDLKIQLPSSSSSLHTISKEILKTLVQQALSQARW